KSSFGSIRVVYMAKQSVYPNKEHEGIAHNSSGPWWSLFGSQYGESCGQMKPFSLEIPNYVDQIATDKQSARGAENISGKGHTTQFTIFPGIGEASCYEWRIERRGLPLTPESLASIPSFASITFNTDDGNGGDCKPEVAKTGLGSSAAMTTAVVGALLHYLGVIKLSSSKDQQDRKDYTDIDLLHKIAQTAHCIAQGKVGSGFDVSSAVYGSQRYVRFSPEVISSVQVAAQALPAPEVISDILNGNWDHERTEFSLPPLMTLLLGEPGTGGSSTPSMVGAVKKWQKFDPQKSLDTWRRLSHG
ncbi:hypothetical protein HN51_024347, partial [Arachis hypogaea]